jgi:hypothetical protein
MARFVVDCVSEEQAVATLLRLPKLAPGDVVELRCDSCKASLESATAPDAVSAAAFRAHECGKPRKAASAGGGAVGDRAAGRPPGGGE